MANITTTKLLQKLSDLGYTFAFSAGAAHKALKVIIGEVGVYVLSKGSTYRWDTCDPQAILRSLNGGTFDSSSSIEKGEPMILMSREDITMQSTNDANNGTNNVTKKPDNATQGTTLAEEMTVEMKFIP
uniref:Uncharacterized protein n=1 Tax=Glossina morsitans morsitans TaxID=37546 RepID=A0A1B0GDQ2_GLOMM